eukprot:c9512_g1_i1.p1 GENE.c9512_g1_i1~~c9512_g1_i1.p1  ORF type:complete len:169 (+),score=14.76 c9512_g1_i1:213-719(+)
MSNDILYVIIPRHVQQHTPPPRRGDPFNVRDPFIHVDPFMGSHVDHEVRPQLPVEHSQPSPFITVPTRMEEERPRPDPYPYNAYASRDPYARDPYGRDAYQRDLPPRDPYARDHYYGRDPYGRDHPARSDPFMNYFAPPRPEPRRADPFSGHAYPPRQSDPFSNFFVW